MEFLVYGPDPPRPSYTQSGNQSVSIEFEGDYLLELAQIDEEEYSTITWRTLALHGISERKQRQVFGSYSVNRSRVALPFEVLIPLRRLKNPDDSVDLVKTFWVLVDHLCSLLSSRVEEEFLRLYARQCVKRATEPSEDTPAPASLWCYPALIPQVWVNWIDYDPEDEIRAARAKVQPFRVDFLLKHEPVSENLTVIELDGLSHFCKSSGGSVGENAPQPSMGTYTEHLKQDRWLRRKGYNVFRFSNEEIHSIVESDQPLSDLSGLLAKNIGGHFFKTSALYRKLETST